MRNQARQFLRWFLFGSRNGAIVRTARLVGHLWNERLTRSGRYVVAGAVTTGIAGSFPEVMVGSYVFSIFASLVLLSLAVSIFRKPRVKLRQEVAERCIAGSTVPLRLTVSNPTRGDLPDVAAFPFRLPEHLRVAGEPQYLPSLPAGQSHSFSYALEAARRGSYTLPGATALSAFPFGLTQAKRFFADSHRLIVYPAFRRLVSLDLPAGRRYQPGGIVLTSQVGESMEFIGNREYRPGDRVRDLHIRSWARVGYPVVKQFQEEFLTRIALLVDTHSPDSSLSILPPVEGQTRMQRLRHLMQMAWGSTPEPPDPVLEANLSLAAGIADHLARQEYVVDLFAAGPDLYHFQAGRSLAYLDNILDILACIDRCPTDPFDKIAPRFVEELGQISTVIALLLDWEPKRQALIRRVLDSGVEVKLIVVSDTLTEADAAAAGVPAKVLSVAQVRSGVESL